jgi:hypothetical protein
MQGASVSDGELPNLHFTVKISNIAIALSLISAPLPALAATYNEMPERCYELTKTLGLVTHWQN